MVKGQGKTADLCTNVVWSICFDSFCFKVDKLGTVDVPTESRCNLLISGYVVQRSRTAHHFGVVHSIYYEPFAWYLPNLEQWLLLESGYNHCWFSGLRSILLVHETENFPLIG